MRISTNERENLNFKTHSKGVFIAKRGSFSKFQIDSPVEL